MVTDHNPYASPDPDALPDMRGLLTHLPDDTTAIVAEGALTRDDYLDSLRIHAKGNRPLGMLFLVVLCAMFLYGIYLFLSRGHSGAGSMLSMFSLVVILAAFVFPPFVQRRTWERIPSLREPGRALFSPEVVQVIRPTSNVALRWSALSGYRRSADLVLLYLCDAPRQFIVVPRHNFRRDSDWTQFVSLVEKQLPRQR